LAVACPAWSVTAIDGTGKKVRFVEESAAALGLTNLDTMHARAEDLVRDGDWRFDLIVVRAVGRMDKVLTETVPLLGPSGAVMFYKTARVEQDEADAAAVVAKRLRFRMDAHRVDLPLGGETLARQLIRYGR
jgi:16S rRNA (guanine527-N7)-methyltransferase